jgi:hypothetical protein
MYALCYDWWQCGWMQARCCCACGGVLVYCLVAKKKQTQTKVQAFDPESAKTGKPPKSDAYECLPGSQGVA